MGAGVPPIDFRAELNEDQFRAVTAGDGPALVLAGAGSGKTRTLTYRVAYLLSKGVRAGEILLLTFTNKAAREMLERVEDLTGVPRTAFWGGTFHHICQRLLRRHGEVVGLDSKFTILDEDDAESLMGAVIREVDPEYTKNKEHPKARVIGDIYSYARNTCQPVAQAVMSRHPWLEPLVERIVEFTKKYQEKKLAQQVADYDDLLELALRALRQEPALAAHYQKRFRYILVDEYQDTNRIQADFVDLLGADHQIMAVGDDAQCIYTWRGAEFQNIVTFPHRHPGTVVHKIEINYRSTPEILKFANRVLDNQPPAEGFRKELRAVRAGKRTPYFVPVIDTRMQAMFVASRIRGLVDEGYSPRDIAVLYRAHYQAMDLQIELQRQNVPFTITSGVRFFEQAHVKDLICHLRFANNPHDYTAFERLACLLPKMGAATARKTLDRASAAARSEQVSLIRALTHESVLGKVPAPAKGDFQDLALTLQNLEDAMHGDAAQPPAQDLFAHAARSGGGGAQRAGSPAEVVKLAIEGWYGDYMRNLHTNWENRRMDLDSLVTFASRYTDMGELLAQLVLLASETADRGVDAEAETVRLTTVHQAKGLEYPVVFVIGLAEGLFPIKRAVEEGNVEEERRLFYVAVTRAKDELYLLFPRVTTAGGPPMAMQASRFVQELPSGVYETLHPGGGFVW